MPRPGRGQDGAPQRGRLVHRGRRLCRPQAPRRCGRARRHHRRGRTARRRRDPDLRPHAARRAPRARPRRRPLRHRRRRAQPPQGTRHRPRVDDVPGHDARGAAADARGGRSQGRHRLPPGDVARAHRPGPYRLHGPHHAEGDGWPHARLRRARRSRLPGRGRHDRPGLLARGGRARQAAREHLPHRQHRARQRARDALRPHGPRRLGGRGRRGHQAVRLHALRARPRARRALPADRPLLPDVEGARARLLDRVHRAGRQGQREHAALLRRPHRARSPRRPAASWPTPATSTRATAPASRAATRARC